MEQDASAAMAGVLTVSDADLADLRDRLARTRWSQPWPGRGSSDWSAGTPAAELRRLVDVWRTSYDWRSHEREISALPWSVADLDGDLVHFLRFDGEGEEPFPIVLTNGWPSTPLELVSVARLLACPSTYGGDPHDAFTVIVPCLPGFGFTPQAAQLLARVPTHELWHRLMTQALGFTRFGAHGGDLGAGVTSLLAQHHPDAVVGIHLLSIAEPVAVDISTITREEQAYLDALGRWFADEGAYEHQQMTRPLTLAHGLSDSPAGLLSWMLEKYWAWSDHGGRLASAFSDDDILTAASVYWFTGCIGTSFRPYFEFGAGLAERVTYVEVPTAIALFPADLSAPPRSWAERTYNVTRYTTQTRGGHFAPHEQPGLLADDITRFFRELR